VKRRYVEILLLLGSACFLAKGGWNLLSYAAFQAHPEWFLKNTPAKVASTLSPRTLLPISLRSSNPLQNIKDLEVLGKLEVPRLGMSVLVVEGDDDSKLGLAAGHMPGTAGLGEKGNSVVSGHRDTAFWPLRKIKVGDRVRIRTGRTYDYVVSNIRVVNPDDVSVLRSDDKCMLTLVTCYPFRYVGSAPKRLIVQAIGPRT